MTTPNTSAVYTVWDVLLRLLGEEAFPPAVEEPNGVKVWFGDYAIVPAGTEPSTERIVVAPTVSAPDETWGPIGQYAREEAFSAYVYVHTAIPGRNALEVRHRLEVLTAAVEQILRSINTGRRGGTAPAEFAVYPSWHVQCGQMLPLIADTPNGAAGTAEFEIRCAFRIGTPPSA